MVCGKYMNTFKGSTHVLFEGNLDDPSFRMIAIQKILSVDGEDLSTEKSGNLKIKKDLGKEFVYLEYVNFFGIKERTRGNPFHDKDTPLPQGSVGVD